MRTPSPKLIERRETYEIRVIGGPPSGLRDLYHALLRVPWWGALAVIVGGYLALNAMLAALFVATGGIANAERGSFVDAFFFSVQTMGTIGYGTMYPATRLANALVVAESVTGLVHGTDPGVRGRRWSPLAGVDTPAKIGPMLRMAGVVVVTEGDVVSQAEREFFAHRVRRVNARARLLQVNGLTGRGSEDSLRAWRDSHFRLRGPGLNLA
jgi:hypothetical protein